MPQADSESRCYRANWENLAGSLWKNRVLTGACAASRAPILAVFSPPQRRSDSVSHHRHPARTACLLFAGLHVCLHPLLHGGLVG